MAMQEITKIGKRGTVVIPAALRRRFALGEGATVIIEECEDGLSVRPAVALPVEIYTPERKAEFLLNNAVTKADYHWAVAEVRRMGLDPEKSNTKKRRGVETLDRVFLDANVLFSAAYAPRNCFLALWRSKGIQLLSSEYAVQETKRNLTGEKCLERLDQMLQDMEIVPGYAPPCSKDLIAYSGLPEKDQPILSAAIHARATHLLTGDKRHFAHCFGKRIGGVLIESPAQYLLGKPTPSVRKHKEK